MTSPVGPDNVERISRGIDRAVLIGITAVAGILVFFCCAGTWLFQVPYYLVAGWAYFLARVGPLITLNVSGLLGALLGGVLFFVSLHLAMRWLYRTTEPFEGAPLRRWRLRWSAELATLVVVAFTSGIAAVGVLHQVGWLVTTPEPLARSRGPERAMSQNNLKQIVLGVHNYHDAHNDAFPPGYTTDVSGRPLHGMLAHLLPYMEQESIFEMIRFDRPWDDDDNGPAMQKQVVTYQSPRIADKVDSRRRALSHYAGNVRTFPANRGLSVKGGIPDGTSNTIMFGEVNAGFRPWGHPLNLRDPAKGIRISGDAFCGPWAENITHFAFADGSVRKISPTISPAVLKALATPAGGERIDEKDW